MKTNQQQRLGALRRMLRFVDRHRDVLGGLHEAASCRAIERAVKRLDTLACEQRTAQALILRHTRNKGERREELWRQHMLPIAAIARAYLHDSPHLPELTLKHGLGDEALALAATAMANAAARHRRTFRQLGLPDSMVAEMRAAIAAFQQAIRAHDASRLLLPAATRQILEELASVVVDVRIVDALVVSRLGKDDSLWAAWQEAKRVNAPATPPRMQLALCLPAAVN